MNILKNIQIKLLAVVSALLLWLFVVGVENYVHLMPTDLPVKVINLGPNVSIANELSKVKVRYKAQDNAGANININEFELFVDADKLADGNYNLDVNYISKNPKITVVAVEPAQITINLEAITSKEIHLKSELVGKPSKDYEVKDFKLSQEKIKVSGAASVLSKINDLVININLDGNEKADFSRKIVPEMPANSNLNGKTIIFDPNVIQADIQVRKIEKPLDSTIITKNSGKDLGVSPTDILVRKTLMAQIIKEGESATSVKELLPQNILVTVEGFQSDIAGLVSNEVSLKLNIGNVVNGIYYVDAKDIVLPQGKKLNIVEFSPDKILVKF